MNIVMSGWPGAGTTTLSLLICHLIDFKYLYGGGVLKYFAENLVGDTSGPKYMQFERDFGPSWDMVWETYAKWKLENSDQLLLEGKTAGFFVEGEQFFEIMVIAKLGARASRAVADQRTDAEATIIARDKEVRERWVREFGIDIYNPQQLQENYDIIIDNSDMTLEQELEYVFTNLEEDYKYPQTNLSKQRDLIKPTVAEYWQNGKDYFRQKLIDRKLIITPREVLDDWNKNLPEYVAKLPPAAQSLVKGTATHV